ncbi:MAG: DUF6265 family protein [Caulobacter sp.]|nr:DUF6265 family protein [Caulobacter sp.]
MRALILAALLLASPAAAQPPAQSLRDVAWLVGEWREVKGDRTVTETWLAADGGVMPGVNRTVRGGKAAIEFMRLDEKDGVIAFTAILPGQAPTTFPATSVGPDGVVFENLEHDFPQRVIYRRCEADLCAAIEGKLGDAVKRIEWRFKRVN